MNLKNDKHTLEFKIPSEKDIREYSRKPLKLSVDRYFEFIELSMETISDLKKLRADKIRHGPTVRFEFKP